MTLKVGGSEVATDVYDSLILVRVEQSVHVPDTFTLRLADPEFKLFDADTFKIGSEVEVSFIGEAATAPAVVTNAEVTAVAVEQGSGGRHELVVTGLGRAHRLAKSTTVRTFVNKKDSDIAATIAGEHDLSSDVDASPVTHEHLIQAESDYAFLSRRARAVGFDWWVSGKKLYFKKSRVIPGGSPSLQWGENLYAFRARFSAAQVVPNVEVRGWDADAQRAVVTTESAPTDADEVGASAPAARDTGTGGARLAGDRFRSVSVADLEEAKAAAAGMSKRAVGTEVTARGEALGDPSIKAGGKVSIEGVGTRLSGDYVVTSVQHIYGSDLVYTTRFQVGGKEPIGLVDLLGGSNGAAAGSVWSGSNLVVGIVSSNNDPDASGRVKVKFPTLGDDIVSNWARVVSLGAGTERGLQIYPEIGDEVIVGFEHGDLRRPLIMGGVWSKNTAAPEADSVAIGSGGKVNSRVLKSRLGHVIEVVDGDSPADKKVRIALSDGKTELLLAEDKVTLTSPKNVTIETDMNFAIKAKQGVTIEGHAVVIKGKTDVTLDAKNFFEAKGNQAKVQGQTNTEIKAGAELKLQGGPIAQLKGGIVKIN